MSASGAISEVGFLGRQDRVLPIADISTKSALAKLDLNNLFSPLATNMHGRDVVPRPQLSKAVRNGDHGADNR